MIYLHNHSDFRALLRIVGQKLSINPALVEKDYWIMHCLYGLQQMGLCFELKGGTSLSKGYEIIHRFSEDIDIQIEPPATMDIKTGRNHNKPAHAQSRKDFYDWLAGIIKIEGIEKVCRDEAFDDDKYRSGGIRLHYKNTAGVLSGIKDGILLEVGFDDVMPNQPQDISSWAYEYAAGKVEIIDNRALAVACYHPAYTLVEKLQTISTKYRLQQKSDAFPLNFMRHYYDVYYLLQSPEVQIFIGTTNYNAHKEKRFRSGDNPVIAENDAFLLADPAVYQIYEESYRKTHALYYKKQPDFKAIISLIKKWAVQL